ncbi:MAG: ABC transporter ATP-binding protein [Rhodospirillales bacterium]
MEPTLFSYIRRYSWREQVLLLVMTFASFPFLYASLELPKIIINQAIAATNFPKNVYGVEVEQVQYLMILCGLFLLLVGANGGFKYFINVYKGRLGERMLRRLRYQLFTQTLRFPIPHFRRTSQGEVIAMITSEVEPLGGFIGDALAQPAFQGGTLLTILAFMFAQDIVLGTAAIALYPLQMYVIPKLQRQVNRLAKQRVQTVRRLAERIGDGIAGIEEIHGNDTAERHRADFAGWVGTIYDIRLDIYRKKFFIKFLNNFIAQLTPFFFYAIGGYLVIHGELTFGALVAVLSAYKDLSSPWKELLDWYQQKEDTRVKYDQLVEQFRPAGMLAEDLQLPVAGPVPRLSGVVVAGHISLEDEVGVKTVDQASFHFDIGQRVALVGGPGSGVDSIARLLARLLQPTSGAISIGGVPLATMPEAVTGRRIAFVGNHVPLINATLRENLLYGLYNREVRPAGGADDASRAERATYIFEAEQSGNTTSRIDGDWIDYAAYDLAGPEDLTARVLQTLRMVDLEPDLFALGLKGIVGGNREQLTQRIWKRATFCASGCRSNSTGALSRSSTAISTTRTCRSRKTCCSASRSAMKPIWIISAIAPTSSRCWEVGLRDEFFVIGLQMAKIMVDLLRDLPPGHEFFDRFSFISSDDLPTYRRPSAGRTGQFRCGQYDDRGLHCRSAAFRRGTGWG